VVTALGFKPKTF